MNDLTKIPHYDLITLAHRSDYFKHSLMDMTKDQMMALIAFQWLINNNTGDSILKFRQIHGLPVIADKSDSEFRSSLVQVDGV